MNVSICEVFMLVDSCGDYAVGNSAEAAREKYEEDIGPLDERGGFRMVSAKVAVPLPECVELVGEVPDLVRQGAGLKLVTA